MGGQDYLFGGAANDILNGGDGNNDRLYGGDGSDILDAGGGTGGQMRGQEGLDTFRFDDALGGRFNTIHDWVEGETLDLRGSGVTAADINVMDAGANTLISYTIGAGTNYINLADVDHTTISVVDDFLFS